MIDHFRTSLLNIADADDATEHLSPGFVPLRLPLKALAVHELLFPPQLSRAEKLYRAYIFERIVDAAGFNDRLQADDPRRSYSIDEINLFNSAYSLDLVKLMANLDEHKGVVEQWLLTDTTLEPTAVNLWHQHPNLVYRLTGLLLAYIERL